MKKCPYCKELIQNNAIKCRYCKRWIEEDKIEALEDFDNNEANEEKYLSKNEEKDIPTAEEVRVRPQLKIEKVRPWVRYWARYFDYCLFGLVAGIILAFIAPPILNINNVLFGILMIFAWVFVEAAFISKRGTTPGKWLLKTEVLGPLGQKLSYKKALNRSLSVWSKGIGLGIPIVILVTMFIEYRKLKNNGATSYDKDGEYIVSHKKIGWKRSLMVVLLFLVFIWIAYSGNYNENSIYTKNSIPNYSSSLNIGNWERYYPGTFNLSVKAPGKFIPYNLELPEENIFISFQESYSYDSNFFSVMISYIEYADWMNPKPEEIEMGAIETMKSGVINLEYETEPILISGISGRLSKGTYKENNFMWGFKQVILLKDHKMWQVIVIYTIDYVDEILSEKVIKSISIENN